MGRVVVVTIGGKNFLIRRPYSGFDGACFDIAITVTTAATKVPDHLNDLEKAAACGSQTMNKKTDHSADLLVTEKDGVVARLAVRGGVRRPDALQSFLNAFASAMLSSDACPTASFIAGKVLQRTERTGVFNLDETAQRKQTFDSALRHARQSSLPHGHLAAELAQLSRYVVWQSGRSGPFASVNFSKAHAHSVLVGPSGIETRPDIRICLILMEPYTRFPDNVQARSKAFVLLSPSEICIDGDAWLRADAGSVFSVEAGQAFAIRCTSQPLLAIWCQLEEGFK